MHREDPSGEHDENISYTYNADGLRTGKTITVSSYTVHSHSYSVNRVIAPTCTQMGYTIYTCQCGEEKTQDYVNALGHDYTNSLGRPSQTCKRCGHKQGDIDLPITPIVPPGGGTIMSTSVGADRTLLSTVVMDYDYIYSGSQLIQLTVSTTEDDAAATVQTMYFTYDAAGTPMAVTFNGTKYFYATNLQGDIVAILDNSGNAVVEYTYDAWGNHLSTTGTMANTLGAVNPLRYRGYVFDSEIGMYYLQSRFYDPELGRFINADAYASTGQGVLGNNMFVYCCNNPVKNADPTGEFGILTALAIAGIAISAIVGGVVAGISAALSGGSTGEIFANAAIGAFSAGAIATVAALGAMGTLSVGTVGLISGGIGATGEIASIAVEHAYHKNDENYTFDLASATTKVIYAGGISAFSGCISYGLNGLYTGADEMIGVCISGETAVAIGLVDFGVRKLISVATGSSDTNTLPPIGGTLGAKHNIAFGY